MVKRKMNDKDWAIDVNVVSKGRENIIRKNPVKHCSA
jgi:hypothetical protein